MACPLYDGSGSYRVEAFFPVIGGMVPAQIWRAYGVPGEPPLTFDARMDAISFARRFAMLYSRRCRIVAHPEGAVQGYVNSDGTVTNEE